jgi:EAL domain-containing protein (putative c-di-GMP-specific phosphodiesterase class I)
VARERLIIELAESVAMANLERARQFARGLRDLGCRLALDDFGAAFGSFYHLKHLPVDLLKLAGDYVRGLSSGNDPTDRLIIEAVVKLARGLTIPVIAGCIGDQETRRELLRLGVQLGQGPLFGASLDISEIARLTPPPGPISAPPRPVGPAGAAAPEPGRALLRAGWPPAPPARCAHPGSV